MGTLSECQFFFVMSSVDLYIQCPGEDCKSSSKSWMHWVHARSSCTDRLKVGSNGKIWCPQCHESADLPYWRFDCGNHAGNRWQKPNLTTLIAILTLSTSDPNMSVYDDDWVDALVLSLRKQQRALK
eukprot:NODE_878_length_667_cov_706.224919_g808_i0.p1 GENE.NODE_878_length_667_cov_706.224919_g808_i0~~NODE_878_length_667_cov_706.224919_g808_i0.p1  ORF type:complete len:134 (-),score=29.41 NODE_878_length_667_cov_706.224919_g808_i0:266-646(-)